MKVIDWNDVYRSFSTKKMLEDFAGKKSGISVGSFDGVHKGHQLLLETLTAECKKRDYFSVVLTFTNPLPSLKKSGEYEGHISSLNQRLNLLENYGIDFVVLVDFNLDFARLSGEEFFGILKSTANMNLIVEGVDFRCGYKGATTVAEIEKWAQENSASGVEEQIKCFFMKPVYFIEGNQEIRISSSVIRKYIKAGRLKLVEELLSRPFQLDLSEASVVSCDNSKKIFDISNVSQVIPPFGEYFDFYLLLKNALPQKTHVLLEKNFLTLYDC
ncbi:MAG: FAD synthetase family protein [Treponema sp.]|nr:FAD synthetase family protein [Treponema sp.]